MTARQSRLAELESSQMDPAFWANQERARTVVQEIKQLKEKGLEESVSRT